MPKLSRDERDFEAIAEALGRSALTIQNDYESAMRKIRWYLLRNKDKRDELYEALTDLVNGANNDNQKYVDLSKQRKNKHDSDY